VPDALGNSTPLELYNQQFSQALTPMLEGQPGQSPLTQAAVQAFQQNTLPIIQQQMQLAGLGRSGALGVSIADAMASAMPQFIQQDIQNRLAAAGMIPQFALGQEGLTQQAAVSAADIANQEQLRQLQALGLGSQTLLGWGGLQNQASQNQLAQMQLALQAAGAGGELQQGIAQQALDAAQLERLRLQGLSEAGTTSLFGGLPATLGQTSTTQQKQSGGSSK